MRPFEIFHELHQGLHAFHRHRVIDRCAHAADQFMTFELQQAMFSRVRKEARFQRGSPEAERHCDLSVRAANLGVHVIQDKPMSTNLSECDRLVEAADRNKINWPDLFPAATGDPQLLPGDLLRFAD